jgi:hypothetical protein
MSLMTTVRAAEEDKMKDIIIAPESQPFCVRCGQRKFVAPRGDYDGATGLPVHHYICQNLRCEKGCSNMTDGLHNYQKQKGWFKSEKCGNCGQYRYDYSE